jgi:hypothetical protein
MAIEKTMKKKWFVIGVSLCAVVLLVMGSLSNVVGYQTVQSSNQSVIKERINQRELLFQTIVDIANNKDIQRIIFKSQMSRGIFPTAEFPVVTKNQLKQIYLIGIMFSKFINKSKIHFITQQYQLSNSGMQQEISAVINKDATLNEKITQLSALNCDCNNDNYKEKGIPDNICEILFNLILMILTPEYVLATFFENMPFVQFMIIIFMGLPTLIVATCIIFSMAFVFNCWGSIPT